MKKTPRAISSERALAKLTGIEPLWMMERKAIERAMKKLSGNKALVAKALGIGKTTVFRKLKLYKLDRPASTGGGYNKSRNRKQKPKGRR